MTSGKVSIIALVVVLLFMPASHAQGVKEVKNVTVEAAMNYNCGFNYVFLLSGNNTLMLRKFDETQVSDAEDDGFPTNERRAGNSFNEHFYFYGPEYGIELIIGEGHERFNYSESLTEFFDNDGPDAVAHRDRKVFYFKNCKLATYDAKGILKQRSAKKLGLPCNPDAAWNSEDWSKIVLLKGDQIWLWDSGTKVEGPMPFSDVYTIRSWRLIPVSERED